MANPLEGKRKVKYLEMDTQGNIHSREADVAGPIEHITFDSSCYVNHNGNLTRDSQVVVDFPTVTVLVVQAARLDTTNKFVIHMWKGEKHLAAQKGELKLTVTSLANGETTSMNGNYDIGRSYGIIEVPKGQLDSYFGLTLPVKIETDFKLKGS